MEKYLEHVSPMLQLSEPRFLQGSIPEKITGKEVATKLNSSYACLKA
jgi:hypothetical protein